jgi:hypothetical protein
MRTGKTIQLQAAIAVNCLLESSSDQMKLELIDRFKTIGKLVELSDFASVSERETLAMYYRFVGGLTLEEVGLKFGCTRNRASQIINTGSAKLRQNVEKVSGPLPVVGYSKFSAQDLNGNKPMPGGAVSVMSSPSHQKALYVAAYIRQKMSCDVWVSGSLLDGWNVYVYYSNYLPVRRLFRQPGAMSRF